MRENLVTIAITTCGRPDVPIVFPGTRQTVCSNHHLQPPPCVDPAKSNIHTKLETRLIGPAKTPRFQSYLASNTFFVSSSLPKRPRFRICPAVGAFSLGPPSASAFLYAACSTLTLAAYRRVDLVLATSPSKVALKSGRRFRIEPLSCDADTRSNPLAPARTSFCRKRPLLTS